MQRNQKSVELIPVLDKLAYVENASTTAEYIVFFLPVEPD